MIKAILFFLITLLSASSWADVHKCVIDGKTVYTDQECPDNKSVPFSPPDINGTPETKISYTGDYWLNDHSGYSIASDHSATENTPVFIYVHTDWCGYCKKLDREFLNDFEVQKTLAKFIKVKINPEHSKDDDKLFKSWGGKGYPSLYVQYPHQPPRSLDHTYVLKDNVWVMMKKEDFIAMLETHLKPFEKAPEEKTN